MLFRINGQDEARIRLRSVANMRSFHTYATTWERTKSTATTIGVTPELLWPGSGIHGLTIAISGSRPWAIRTAGFYRESIASGG
jgi:hypothetical protein